MSASKYLTNAKVVGVLCAVVVSMGGYILSDFTKGSDAQASSIASALHRLGEHDIEIATMKNTLKLNQEEILRRLQSLDERSERLERHMFRLRSGNQNP